MPRACDWDGANGIRRVRVLGNAGTIAPLAAAGIEVVAPSEPAERVEAVFTGWFREFGFPHLEAACNDVWAGAKLTSASHVPFFATDKGRGIGASFAINVMITALTDVPPLVLGKPSVHAFAAALRRMGLTQDAAGEVVVVGDDPALEMRMANDAGAISVCVATGLQTLDTMTALEGSKRPALALAGVEALAELIE